MTRTSISGKKLKPIARPLGALIAILSIISSHGLAQTTPAPAPTSVTLTAVRLTTTEGPVELFGPAGVRDLPSGAVLFADRKPVTVRVSELKTGAVRQTARAGAGPGEFRSAPEFVGFAGDSVAAYDAMLRRWSVMSPAGAFVRLIATDDPLIADKQSAVRVYHRAMVFNASLGGASAPSAAAISAVVKAMSSAVGAVVVRQVEHGDLWAADAFSARQWRVFDHSGAPLTTVVFDRDVRVTSLRNGHVLGVAADEDEIPVIVRGEVSGFSRASPRAVRKELAPKTTASGAASERLGALLKSLVMRQEQAYADGGSYTTSVPKLGVPVPPTFDVRVLQATDRGWFAVATDKSASVTCAIGVGFAVIGWDEGKPECSAR